MKEFGALFVSGYLVSLFFMVPLMGFYLILGLKRAPLSAILQFHKILVLLSIILPVGLVLMSLSSDLKAEFGTVAETSQTQALTRTMAVASHGTEVGDFSIEDPAAGRWPGIQDVAFYVVDYIGLFSVLGLLIFVLRYGIQTRRLSNIKQAASVLSINGKCLLIESDMIRWPFSVGYFWKSIFIPQDMPAAEKGAVIQHELIHFQCRHHLWSLLEVLLACIFWFNPLAHILRRRGTFLRELECDGRTVQNIDRYEYTRLLVKTAEGMAGAYAQNRFSLLTQAWVRKGELKMRIENLLHKGREKKKTVISLIVAAAVVVTVVATLIYGNLRDATQQKILADVNQEYSQRAPISTRVEIGKVPPDFINALLVHEDAEFYEHGGVRLKSALRAAGGNIKSFFSGKGFYRYGGSTITQQLAKQFINDRKRSWRRKFRELRIARVLEGNFTKDELMEMYLNMIYFGNDAYGLKAASETYFGHDYKGLTLDESAMIVPFITAPSIYNMQKYPVVAKRRQQFLLEKIADIQGG
jgi:beta-lactamase regulating signal transducer with metallopeptidase domain